LSKLKPVQADTIVKALAKIGFKLNLLGSMAAILL